MTGRPILLIDVDGVLNPYRPRSDEMPPGYTAHDFDGIRVLLATEHGKWLHHLAASYDIVWATTWEADANRLIGPAIGAPADLPFLTFPDRDPQHWTWKLPAVERYVGARPVAWLDDDHGYGAVDWATARSAPTLLVRPDQRVGWTRNEFDQLVQFAASLS